MTKNQNSALQKDSKLEMPVEWFAKAHLKVGKQNWQNAKLHLKQNMFYEVDHKKG
jgi:hypothetical protein